MNCREVRFYLYEYIHNEVDEYIRTEIEHHLMVCEDCKKELEKTASILNAIPSASDILLPDDLRSRIIYKTLNTPFRKFPRKIFASAAIFLIASILSFLSVKVFFKPKPQGVKMDYYIIQGKHHNYIKPMQRQGGNIYYVPADYEKGPF